MKPGMDFAKEHNADILIATDPDADRCGIAIKDKNNEYVLLTGNEIGVLLLNYICERKVSAGKMPSHPVAVKSIVSTDLAKEVGKSYGVEVKDVLTGFKYIGEAIKALEDKGCEDDYLFGFEESYGFLSGGYVRDKDAVDASFLIAEMFSFYKTKGISLNDKLNDIYGKYGYYINNVKSYEFKGSEGAKKMALIMESLRKGEMSTIGTLKVLKKTDYMEGINGLPKADVIKYELDGKSSVIVRPSGTEPKIKVYAAAVSISPVKINCHFMPVELFIMRNKEQFDYIFLDPPFPYKFHQDLILKCSKTNALKPGGTLLIHRPAEKKLDEKIGNLIRTDHRVYGRSEVDFYSVDKNS